VLYLSQARASSLGVPGRGVCVYPLYPPLAWESLCALSPLAGDLRHGLTGGHV
jgi:hypothetical protein